MSQAIYIHIPSRKILEDFRGMLTDRSEAILRLINAIERSESNDPYRHAVLEMYRDDYSNIINTLDQLNKYDQRG